MEIITVMLYAAVVLVSLLLIGLVLVQPSKSGGLGAAFGGGLGESVFGAQAGSHLTKLTVVMTTIFFVLTLMLALLVGRGQGEFQSSAVNEVLSESNEAPVGESIVKDAAAETAGADALVENVENVEKQ